MASNDPDEWTPAPGWWKSADGHWYPPDIAVDRVISGEAPDFAARTEIVGATEAAPAEAETVAEPAAWPEATQSPWDGKPYDGRPHALGDPAATSHYGAPGSNGPPTPPPLPPPGPFVPRPPAAPQPAAPPPLPAAYPPPTPNQAPRPGAFLPPPGGYGPPPGGMYRPSAQYQPGYPPMPYGAYYGRPVYVGPSTNGFAVASLVLGVLGCFGISVVVALVFGVVALVQIGGSQGRMRGTGMAWAGILISLAWIALFVLLVAVGNTSSTSG